MALCPSALADTLCALPGKPDEEDAQGWDLDASTDLLAISRGCSLLPPIACGVREHPMKITKSFCDQALEEGWVKADSFLKSSNCFQWLGS